MAVKQSSPLSHGRFLTVVIVSSLAAISFSAPLSKRQSGSTRPLHLDDIGAYFNLVIDQIHFTQTNLSLELNGTIYEDIVCPLFGVYSRMQQTIQSLPEDDERNHIASVATFVVKRQTQSLCDRVKANCTQDQLCAIMSCNVSSIAQTCLDLTLFEDQVEGLWGEDRHQDRSNSEMIPLWLDEIFSRGYPDANTTHTLIDLVQEYTLVKCTLPEGSGDDSSIECIYNF